MDKTETKTVYVYDATGLYTGTQVLDYTDRSPINGTWQIPGNSTELDPESKNGYDAYFISGVWTYVAQIVDVICYYNYGVNFKTVKSNYTAATGEILFSATPTTAELTAAFPSIAGNMVHMVTKIPVITDTIKVQDVTLTATASTIDATNFAVGTTIALTVANIVTALKANATIAQYWDITSSDATFTLTEKIAGNRSTPTAITTTGTTIISSGTPINSVYGYKNAVMSQQLIILNQTYRDKLYPIERALVTAYASGNTAIVTSNKELLTSINAEWKAKAEVITNG
jgi:hypothetical protein